MNEPLAREIASLMSGPPRPEGGAAALLHILSGGVLFAFSRIIDDLQDEELRWAPVKDAVDIGWVPTGHDHRSDPFSTIGWRWAHLCEALHAIASSETCLGPGQRPDATAHTTIDGAAAAVAALESGIRRAARAIASATEERLDEEVGSDFGRHSRRHWVSLLVMEAIHHAAEIGVLRDLFRRSREATR